MTPGYIAIVALSCLLVVAVIALIVIEVFQPRDGAEVDHLAMSRQAIKVLAVAAFIGLLAFVGTRDLAYGLGVFVIVFLGFGGWEVLTRRRG
jgi:hypothetical protein